MFNYKCEKYIITTNQNNILTLKGFINSDKIKYSQVRLFPSVSHAKQFIEQSKYCNCEGLIIKKIIVNMQEI